MLKITGEMREAAGKLREKPPFKLSGSDRELLAAISDGKRKQIKAHWWAKFFKKIDQIKLDKLQALADPARNPSVHERTVASSKLDHFKASRAPGMPPEAPPFPTDLVRHKKPEAASDAARPVRTTGSVILSPRAKKKMMQHTQQLLDAWGIDAQVVENDAPAPKRSTTKQTKQARALRISHADSVPEVVPISVTTAKEKTP